VVDVLIDICFLLGVVYDENQLNVLSNECDKVEYLLNQIYIYLGGN